MSANCGQLNNNEDSEVMVRQVNLAAAFHDHISCTKMSQHSIGSGICGLQSADMSDSQNATIGSELSTAFESDHMYATESKPYNENSVSANGCLVRANSLFANSLSEERNQISKLTEMILGQLDLIQHQQEQLLKKDRQLQGLKQDREALCLRLEKMEKRIAVLSAKVANNTAQTVTNSTTNNASVNANSNTINVNRSVKNSQTVSVGVETDCDQSGSDTIVEETTGGSSLFTETTAFTKLYSHSSAVNSSVNSVNKSTITAKPKPLNSTPAVHLTKIKTEPQDTVESSDKSFSATVSSAMARKSRKRQTEVVPTTTNSATTGSSPKKRSKPSISSDITANEDKKEIFGTKETSCDSSSTTQTTNLTKTLNNKKKVVKPKSETSSRVDITHSTTTSLNLKIVTKDVLMTSKPYPIAVNMSQSPLEVLTDSDNTVNNNTNCEEMDQISDLDVIEVPSWRLHPVSSCYSLEGTENLDDEVFNRRHMKLENDERRRKRWDIQRLREHRYNERLRTGRYYNSGLNNCFIEKPSDLKKKGLDFDSFYPEIKNLQYIEVAEKIPVIAFGHPIPKLPIGSFWLPWRSNSKSIPSPSKDRRGSKTS